MFKDSAVICTSSIAVCASRLLTNVKVQARLVELREQSTSPVVSSITERKERLTTFIEEELTDRHDKKVRTSNIQAIAELNKMDGVYDTGTININDIRIQIIEGE